MKRKRKQVFIISGVIFVLVALLGFAAWFITRPEEKTEVASKEKLNVEWYDKDGKEFTITTAEELFEFAALSSYYDFKGQTIKLGADIVVNEGDASEWGNAFPENIWDKPVDNFAGTFDGQGHTISGIYCMGFLYKCSGTGLKPLPAGLFSNTKAECVIKNFRLVNSYFFGDLQNGAGTISACGGGTFESIYSDAILVSYKYYNGGIIGMASESTTIRNCWYDGKMEIIGGYARYTGGLIGRTVNFDDSTFTIEHCLVTATMDNETEKCGVGMGALVGNVRNDSTLTVDDCFVASKLTNEWSAAVGSVYGVSEERGTVNMTNTYALDDGYKRLVGAILGTANGMPVDFPRELVTGYGGYQWTTLDFDNYWAVVEDGTPILKTFADVTPSLEGVERYVDISWYTSEATEYVLTDKADLYGFSILSRSWNFEGKTVKLGADIVVNEGKASNWAKEAPMLEWISISPKSKPFAGVFDGKMHTISGLYMDTDEANSGLFSATADTSTIKNLKLKNSYFKSEATDLGSIAGQGRGAFDTVYSDAIVVAAERRSGGLIGMAYGTKVSMKNCWFAGSVTNISNDTGKRGTGGLIGVVYDGGSAKVQNCLNTGTIDVRSYTANQSKTEKPNVSPIAGGLVGWVKTEDSAITIQDSLNTGKILVSDKVTYAYGSIIGLSDSTAKVSHTYATVESSANTVKGSMDGWALAFHTEKLTGHGGYIWTTLNFDKYWSVMEKGTPVLKSFEGKGASTSGIVRMVDTSWYDEKKDTYILNDAAELYGLVYLSKSTDFAKKTIKLGADIAVNDGNAADWANVAPANEWMSIGSKDKAFAGTFDGQMHTISGIYMNTDVANSGLFSATEETSVIKNLRLTNSYIASTSTDVGSIAGQGRGAFDAVYSDAIIVAAERRSGGLVGMAYGTKVSMKNCWFAGNVTNTSNAKEYRGTGGLIGVVYDGGSAKLEGCLNTGTVDVSSYTFNQNATGKPNVSPIAGGLVGYVKTAKSKVDIKNCLNTGAIKISHAATGAYGAIVGLTENKDGTTVSTTYTTVTPASGNSITGKISQVAVNQIVGYKGYQRTNLDFDKYWAVVIDDEATADIDESGTPILKVFASVVPDLSKVELLMDFSWIDADGTEKDPYIISDIKDLYGLAVLAAEADYKGFAGKYFKLGADITANTGNASVWDKTAPEYIWTPIGTKEIPFAGIFDGDMHTISGIYLNTNVVNGGLFGVTGATSTIKNLKLTNSYFTSTASGLGSIAGQGRGTLDTVYSNATVVGSTTQVGGFVGLGYGGKLTLNKCWFDGIVKNKGTAAKGTGGFVGVIYTGGATAMTDCLNSGTVDASAYTTNAYPLVGGLTGHVQNKATLTTTDCLSVGTVVVASGKYGGIIAGIIDGGSVTINTTYGYGAARVVSYMQNSGKFTVNYILNGTPGTSERTTQAQYSDVPVVTKGQANFIGDTAKTKLEGLDFDKKWSVVPGCTPVLKAFEKEVIDTSWYKASESTYTLKDKADLYGLAQLSKTNDFAGKKIQLGADIVVNEGNADTWAENAPKYAWEPIGTKETPFAGIFDGNMHTISGIYLNTDGANSGLFGITDATSTIKNLKLTNSYFTSTASGLGSIAGQGRGSIDTVYSNATVVSSNSQVGGLVGLGYGEKLTLNKCWFDGTVKNTGTAAKGTGGLVGVIYTGGTTKMTDCLNSGTVDASAYTTNAYPLAGGLTGHVQTEAILTTTDCLSVGGVTVDSGKYGGIIAGIIDGGSVTINTTYGYGADRVVAYMSTNSKFTVNYILNGKPGTSERTTQAQYTNVPVVTSSQTPANFIGETAKTKLEGFDFDKVWMVVPNQTPILKSFK